jgi:hypothetical protein
LCQERAFVSGLEASNHLLRSGSIRELKGAQKLHKVLPIRDDELQVELGRKINKNIQNALVLLKLDSFWVR